MADFDHALLQLVVVSTSSSCYCWYCSMASRIVQHKSLWNSVSIGTMCSAESYNKRSKCSLSALTRPQSFCYSFILMSIIRCSKSVQIFAVQVCQVSFVRRHRQLTSMTAVCTKCFARLITRMGCREHISPVLQELHWAACQTPCRLQTGNTDV